MPALVEPDQALNVNIELKHVGDCLPDSFLCVSSCLLYASCNWFNQFLHLDPAEESGVIKLKLSNLIRVLKGIVLDQKLQ